MLEDLEQANPSPLWPQFPHLTNEGFTEHSLQAFPGNTDRDPMVCVGEWGLAGVGKTTAKRGLTKVMGSDPGLTSTPQPDGSWPPLRTLLPGMVATSHL